MNVSMQWLHDYIKQEIDPHDLAEKLSLHAQEVADVRPLYPASGLVLGTVETTEPIPGSKNQKCAVTVNGKSRTIVCGAPNVAAGQSVIVADLGAKLPGGVTIEQATINGVASEGMIVSLDEIGLDKKYHQETGIHVLRDDAGQSLAALGFDDHVVELDLTPNRMDLMSVLGVAYEVSALYDTPLTDPKVTLQESDQAHDFTTAIDTDQCDAYYGRVIEGVEVKESPEWLKNRLIAAGIRPINTIVDVTNYVMMDLGQPLHAFDADTIPSKTIRVKAAEADETFTTLDGQTRTLKRGDILITDGENPIALGGVMGGLDSEVTPTTTTVFLESALFNATRIGKTSRRLDLRSEASMRFERGIAHDRALLALDKAAQMMAELSGGIVLKGVAKAERQVHTPRVIDVALDRVNGLLGTSLSITETQALLTRLHLEVKAVKDHLSVTVPVRRLDIVTEQDLIEEIGRLYGYNELPLTYPKTVTEGYLTNAQKKRRQLKRHLEGLGLFEAISYSLTHPDKETGFTDRAPTRVLRPLSEDHQSLRQTLIPSLLSILQYHQARQMPDVCVYELGSRYLDTEDETLSLALKGRLHPTAWLHEAPVDFYTLKGIVEHIGDLFGVHLTFKKSTYDAMHPHQTADVYVKDIRIGMLGAVHPQTLNAYDLKHAFVAELSITTLQSLMPETAVYHPVSKMPSVTRDVAFITDQALPASTLVAHIQNAPLAHLTGVEIFDVYTGEPLSDHEKSIALSVTFNDENGTFKAADIDAMMETLTQSLVRDLGIRVRE